MKLYIIGNGFDLHHGLKTSFFDFKQFMESKNIWVIKYWQEIISIKLNENWTNLEKSFEHVDYDQFFEKCLVYLKGYSDDNWKDSYHHDYEYEINSYLDLSINSNEYLREWLDNTDLSAKPKIKLDKDSLFLTFNYTDLLEECYEIPRDKICHIHGSYANGNMILGHNNSEINTQKFIEDDENLDVRITGGNRIINKSTQNSFKNSDKYIQENIEFFNRISDITEIIIIGHSSDGLSSVDRDYYCKIREILGNKDIEIKVISFKENVEKYKEELKSLGFYKIKFWEYSYIEEKRY